MSQLLTIDVEDPGPEILTPDCFLLPEDTLGLDVGDLAIAETNGCRFVIQLVDPKVRVYETEDLAALAAQMRAPMLAPIVGRMENN